RDDAAARKAEARRIFLHVLDTAGDADLRATAAQAFRNIDDPLGSAIARWQQVLSTSQPTFSALHELAQLAEQRDELALAAASYRAAFRMLPERKSVLLELDDANSALRRELAYLLLAMSGKDETLREEAEREFQRVVTTAPEDYLAAAQLGLLFLSDHRDAAAMPLLKSVLAHADAATANRVRMALHMPLVLEDRGKPDNLIDPRILGERSYNAGFLKDALHFFTQAREANPVDASVALKLGWTNNLLHDDAAALRWFDVARRSADNSVAHEAEKAYRNLHPGLQRIRTTVWIYPLYSSRWSDLFGYGQVKTDLRLRKLPVRPYVSVRYVGDVRRVSSDATPQNLSESAFIVGAGVASRQWHGGVAWFEGGEALRYIRGEHWKDFRGGISYSAARGASLSGDQTGMFWETAADAVYVRHFANDEINYSQNKIGYTREVGGFRAQAFWAANVVFDVNRQYWANFVETGPGLRFRPPGFPKSASVTVNAIRGVYLLNEGNPRRPNFNDVRVGVWYAFTK
ncbi:MAG: hypothetical protein ABUS51_01255, partial [Acidobacteriota bacterium]